MSKHCSEFRNRALALAVAGVLGVSGTALAVGPVSATARTGFVAVPVSAAAPAGAQFSMLSRATRLNRGDVVASVVPLNKPVPVTVALKLRDPDGMRAFLEQPSHGRMSQAQLQRHLPTSAQAQAVAKYLEAAGFTDVRISANRMLVNAVGNGASVQAAFKTPLVNVHTHDGRSAFANSAAIQVPAALHDSVQAVLGLQTVHVAHTMVGTAASGRVGVQGHYPGEFADIYGASDLAPATDVDVAVWGWGSMQEAVNDLDEFMAGSGLGAGTVSVVCTDYDGYAAGGVVTDDPTCNGFDQGSNEWDMDSQSLLGMTGGVKSLVFYSAYGANSSSITNSLNEIIAPTAGEPLAQVINASFGGCERAFDADQGGDGSAQVDDALFQIAVAQGQTFAVSTGDYGADECGDGQPDSASYPASSPWVVAVSGTTLRASDTVWARENAWLGAGGSPSSFEPAPAWQAAATFGPHAGTRGPDVAFDANPNSGELVWIAGGYQQWGGTSLAAPLFAGAWARILQGDPELGFAAPYLYTLPAAVLHDVRSGNNGGYLAIPGWDWATGLGSFDVGRAAAILVQPHAAVPRHPGT